MREDDDVAQRENREDVSDRTGSLILNGHDLFLFNARLP